MEVYKCLTDGYVHVKKGDNITIKNNVAHNKDGDTLDIDIVYLRGSEDFVRTDQEAPSNKKQQYTIAAKLGSTFPSLEAARDEAEKQGNSNVFIVKIIGKVSIEKKLTYTNLEE